MSKLTDRVVVRESAASGFHLFDIQPTKLPAGFGLHITTDRSAIQIRSYLHAEAPYFDFEPAHDDDVATRLGDVLTDVAAGRIACFGKPGKRGTFTHRLVIGAEERLVQARSDGPSRGYTRPYLVVGRPW